MKRNSGSKSRKSAFLSYFLSILIATLLISTSCSPTPKTTWSYSEFVQAVEQNRVESVSINPNRSQATVVTQDGAAVLVNLPNDPDLIGTLQENEVDVSVVPQADKDGYARVAATFLVPITFLVSLLGFLFWVWMLIDCAANESNQGNTKIVWILIILFVNFVGALIYFFVRRPERRKELGN